MLSNTFSKAELKLIEKCNPAWHDIIMSTEEEISPIRIYEHIALSLFMNNETGPHVDAIRRVIKALRTNSVYRRTPEFDELCRYE